MLNLMFFFQSIFYEQIKFSTNKKVNIQQRFFSKPLIFKRHKLSPPQKYAFLVESPLSAKTDQPATCWLGKRNLHLNGAEFRRPQNDTISIGEGLEFRRHTKVLI